MFGQVGDHDSQVKDQVGQGQCQELDNKDFSKKYTPMSPSPPRVWKKSTLFFLKASLTVTAPIFVQFTLLPPFSFSLLTFR